MGEKWLKLHKDWLPANSSASDNAPVDDDTYGVPFIPIRCPRCNSKDVRCYVTRPPVRYHVCRECGMKFKSVEAV